MVEELRDEFSGWVLEVDRTGWEVCAREGVCAYVRVCVCNRVGGRTGRL